MIKEVIVELKKLGVNANIDKSNIISVSTDIYDVTYTQEERECLVFLSTTEKKSSFGKLEFTKKGETKSKIKYALKLNSSTPKEVAEWIKGKIDHPERDPETLKKLEEFKTRVKNLNLDWIEKDRSMNISPEFEELGKIRIASLAINYNDIITDDHMLLQIKTLLDQPGNPKLYLFKTVSFENNVTISEEEFDENNLENVIKRAIMFKYLDLSERAVGGDEAKIKDRVEAL